MEFIIGALALASLVLNVMIYRRLPAVEIRLMVESTVEPEAEAQTAPVTTQMVKDVYLSRALPSTPKATAGPLERPGGFV